MPVGTDGGQSELTMQSELTRPVGANQEQSGRSCSEGGLPRGRLDDERDDGPADAEGGERGGEEGLRAEDGGRRGSDRRRATTRSVPRTSGTARRSCSGMSVSLYALVNSRWTRSVPLIATVVMSARSRPSVQSCRHHVHEPEGVDQRALDQNRGELVEAPPPKGARRARGAARVAARSCRRAAPASRAQRRAPNRTVRCGASEGTSARRHRAPASRASRAESRGGFAA